MPWSHRRIVALENDLLRLETLPAGGHIASVRLKPDGVNPLWDPPWETIEPSSYDSRRHPEYGAAPEAGLLAGIVGHNLCFDFFGAPSEEEQRAGLMVHGEASVVDWRDSRPADNELVLEAELPLAQMRIERRLRLAPGSRVVQVQETAENLASVDRAVGWQQHVTLGPPFLEKGKTLFRMPATRCRSFDAEFAPGHDRVAPATDFDWPSAPTPDGGVTDLQVAAGDPVSGAYTAQLLDPAVERPWFTAWSPTTRTLFGYVWRRSDFPWIGIWEENSSRRQPPWNGRTLTRGLEFGTCAFPEGRRGAVERGRLFGERTYGWIPARSKVTVEYRLFLTKSDGPADKVVWRDDTVEIPGLGAL